MRLTKRNSLWYFIILLIVLMFQLVWYGAILGLWMMYAFFYGLVWCCKKAFRFLSNNFGKKVAIIVFVVFFVFLYILGAISNALKDEPTPTEQTPIPISTSEPTTIPTTEATIETTVPTTEATIEPTETAPTVATENVTVIEKDYVLNTSSMKFHYPSCSGAAKIKESNKAYFTGTREEVIQKGYSSCGICHP
jgi:energy-coupling factor transporter transmembrane protein EcfT